MKATTTTILIFFTLFASAQTSYLIWPGVDGGVYQLSATKYKGGDTLILQGKYSYVFFEGLKGDTLKTISIVPSGLVTISQHIDLLNCKFVKVDGGSNKNIVIDQNNPASNKDGTIIHGYSDHIELTNIIYRNCGYGIWCKNEHEELLDTNVSNHVLRYISVHDNEFYNIGQHGIGYFGATNYPNTARPVIINGVVCYPNPSLLGDIKVYNNKVDHCGRNGFMLCIAPIGDNEVYNNTIKGCGFEPNQDQQGGGIVLGGFTSAYVHNNTIDFTLLWGIRSFGGKNVRIENNTITNSGNNGLWSPTNWPSGYTLKNWTNGPANIAIGEDSAFNASGTKMTFSIKSNALSNAGFNGWNTQVWDGNYTTNNSFCSNTGTYSIGSNVRYNTCAALPIRDTVKPQQPNNERYTVELYDYSGRLIDRMENVEIGWYKSTLPKNRYFILKYYNNKVNKTEKLFKR